MKGKYVALIIILILLLDQGLKIWIKTSYPTGEVMHVFGQSWFRLHFIENSGMAWGWKLGNSIGKLVLTLFRLVAVIWGTFYLRDIVRKKYTTGFIVCAALIYAGAAGNLIDSMFYGLIFDKGWHFDPALNDYVGYAGVAHFSTHGYASFFHGSVVDMLYWPIIENGTFPQWVPFVGGQNFTFFNFICNVADVSISVGVIVLLLWQKKFLPKKEVPPITIENE